MIWELKRIIKTALEDVKWSLASKLIGHNTRRAIYFGPDPMTITWESKNVVCVNVMGAKNWVSLHRRQDSNRF